MKEINKDSTQKLKTIMFIPIMIVLAIVPLIVRVHMSTYADSRMSVAGETVFDMYFYNKCVLIFIATFMMVGLTFFFFKKEYVKVNKFVKIIFAGLLVFLILSLLSTFLSPYKDFVWGGAPKRFEGMFIYLCYIIMLCYSFLVYNEKEDIKFILIPLGIMTLIEFVFLMSQYMGKDLLMSNLLSFFVVPGELREAGSISTKFSGKVSGTLFNPNYVGSFTALLLPIFMMGCFIKNIKYKVFSIICSITLFLSLLASGSRAGLVGLIMSVIFFVVILFKLIVSKPKILALILSCIVAGVGLAFVLGGDYFKAIMNITIQQTKTLFSSVDKNANKYDIPLSDIKVEGDTFVLELSDGGQVKFILKEDGFELLDENNNEITYVIEDNYIVPSNAFYKFQIGEVERNGQVSPIYLAEIAGHQLCILELQDGQINVMNKHGFPLNVERADYIGFEGKENLASGRGYIWSRSLPLLKNHLILGCGPDAFVAEFPHGDYVAKWELGMPMSTLVDKPHNLYLQLGINHGVIALLAFLVMNITYIVWSFRLYFGKKQYEIHQLLAVGLTIGVIGYLAAGMFNDSVVAVAPLYWTLLGIGMAMNFINENIFKEIK